MTESLEYIEEYAEDIETLFSGASGENWEYEAVQLSPGLLAAKSGLLRLPDIGIYWTTTDAAIHMREHHKHDAVFLTFLLGASTTARWYGREVAAGQALMYFPGQEQDYVLPGKTCALGFMISRRLLLQMGWELRQTPLQLVDQRAMRKVIDSTTRVCRAARRGRLMAGEPAELVQERLALVLSGLIDPWLQQPGDRVISAGSDTGRIAVGRHYHLIEKARRFMQQHDPAEKLNIRSLAKSLGTSPRTLYRAFTDYLGMGPYEYFTLLRLHSFRQTIRSSGQYHGAITEAAALAGFSHLGRFSQLYRQYYGELPRDSLQRWM